MRGQGRFIAGLLLGVGLAYLLDPERGARRRAIARDKATSAGRRLAGELDARTRDLRNRASGKASELRSRFRREEVGDEVLHDRVRAAIGRVVSRPRAVVVSVWDGKVTLRGQVLEAELAELIRTASGVRGVSEVVNQLEVHAEPGNVPSLQGGRTTEA